MKPSNRYRYDWHDIVYFLALMRQRSIVRAAKTLRVDHTTVSRRIRELEASLSTTLFTRSKTGVHPTEAGLRLLQYAEGMESQANSIVEAIGLRGADASGTVRIATMEGLGSLYLTKCFEGLAQRYPDIQIDLITDSRMLDMSRREADVFVTFFKPAGPRLSLKKIGEFKVSLFAGRRYFETHSYPRRVQDLDQHVFIDFIDELVHVNENRWLSDVFKPHRITFRSTSLVAQYMSASNGHGIAMLPSFVAAHNPDLVPVMPELSTTRDIWLSAHEDLLHIARIKAVTAFLEQRVAEDQAYLMPQGTPPEASISLQKN